MKNEMMKKKKINTKNKKSNVATKYQSFALNYFFFVSLSGLRVLHSISRTHTHSLCVENREPKRKTTKKKNKIIFTSIVNISSARFFFCSFDYSFDARFDQFFQLVLLVLSFDHWNFVTFKLFHVLYLSFRFAVDDCQLLLLLLRRFVSFACLTMWFLF